MTDREHPARELPGRRTEVDAEPVDPEERPAYSPFDLEPDELETRPASESWREALIRGRATRTPLLLHNLVFLAIFAVAAVVITVVLLISLLG